MASTPPKGMSRRQFAKYAAIGGLAAWGVVSGLVYPSGWSKWLTYGQKPWELTAGVVDYDLVADHEGPMDQYGVPSFYREGGSERRTLNVAQWYDYWPGKTITDFTLYMQERFNLDGVQVRWTANIYTSNEELFTWVTQTGRKFDVMVPTNYTVETMEKAGLLVNLNRDWLPNYACIFGPVPTAEELDLIDPWIPDSSQPTYPTFGNGYNTAAGSGFDFRTPSENPYQYRMNQSAYPNPRGSEYFTWDAQNSLLAVPYQWGTTGIGYRSDVFRRADIEDLGWEVFELTSYRNPDTGRTYDLTNRKMMLDDMREVFTAGHKIIGWKHQEDRGLLPTAITYNPAPPYNGEFQWSSNEIEDAKLVEATDWLLGWQESSWGFNTPQQGPWLISGERFVDQAWSGDIMYAVRPNSSQFVPVDYFIPKEGGARWIDNLVIHRECEKLWLAHQFINYIHDPVVQADVSTWNLYASPNAWSFQILHRNPIYSYEGRYPDSYWDPSKAGQPYYWNPAEDYRIYSDFAAERLILPGPDGQLGTSDDVERSSDIAMQYTELGRPPILDRCEYQHDVGVKNTLRYFKYWRTVKF